MIGFPSHFQAKGGIDFDIAEEFWKQKRQQVNSFISSEPTSALHMRRSSSPPTSASTLSSSFNGGGIGGGNSTEKITTTATEEVVNPVNNKKKDEWASELQPIPNGIEIASTGERCGVGLEEWDNMLSETNQEPSLLRWIGGDVDESFGLRQLSHGGINPSDFDGNGGLGIVDQGPAFDSGIAGGVSAIATNLTALSSSGFSSNNSGNEQVGSTSVAPPSFSAGLANYRSFELGSNSNSNTSNCNIQDPIFCSSATIIYPPATLPANMLYHHQIEHPKERPQILNPQMLINQEQFHKPHPQNPNFFSPLAFSQQENHLLQPQPKRRDCGSVDPMSQMINRLPFNDSSHELLRRKHQQQQRADQQQHQHSLVDQLYKAAELVGTGNFSRAQAILARLNQQLSPVGKPLHRAVFYFTEALQLLLMNNNPVIALPPRSPTPFDVIFKMGAYKVFSEISPFIQFVNFTCNQILLEALKDAKRIHIIDFDIGFGAQWASFMQELPRNGAPPSLKITAFVSLSTHHPVEVLLMRDNLTQFANDIGITFEFDVINFDSLVQNCYSLPIFRPNRNEAVAVNFPIWSSSNQPSALPSMLHFVKQLSPKILVSLDRGCDRADLPFPQHILYALQSYIHLFESLDAVNVHSDALNKIEKFVLQPKIESSLLGRLCAPDKMPNWKTIFASAGFAPVPFSTFTETQAECVVKRTPVRGFHVEKRQPFLVLCWQHRELISVCAWSC